LKIKTHATDREIDPPLPPSLKTETKLQRDEWMLMPSEGVPESLGSSSMLARAILTGDESLAEDYGESSTNKHPPGGGVDFFSSLGTERKRPPRPDKPNPDNVQYYSYLHTFD